MPAVHFFELDSAVEAYLGNCVAPTTLSVYRSAQRRYFSFCQNQLISNPFPVTEDTLCRFVAALAQDGLKHRTIKSYLSGIRFAQILQAMGNPFTDSMPRLEYVLSGIKRSEAHAGTGSKPRLPITMEMLSLLKAQWLSDASSPDKIMLWAAACTGFFGFLHAGEFTVPSPNAYDPKIHLNLQDIALDSYTAPSMIRLLIKQSKTDPLRQGVEIFLGATQSQVCPVEALIKYIGVRRPDPGPLFIFQSGAPLTRQALVSHLHEALGKVGIDHSRYNGHSFRIGAATTAAQRGLEDSLIQTLGRWKSSAYKLYIKIPRSQLAEISRKLAQASSNMP